jgi:hypothetical protein
MTAFAIITKLSGSQGAKPGDRQRANLENDTEETSTGSCRVARIAGRQERGSEIGTVRIL